MTAEALALAAEHLAASRRSVIRLVALSTARAIARGRVPHVAANIEASLLDDLNRRRGDADVDITWHAHAGHLGEEIQRLPWQPGTPLPELALSVTCTVSAPLAAEVSR